ncbi:uncharacterized protein [Venturia canescens]|uniref:uncharacterized protein n=1 Tax=Venturia canescens TaxID=32260 RepID=UPI001C9D1C54|nr:uncharacterized protein LOC122407543 [Venturia canescens]
MGCAPSGGSGKSDGARLMATKLTFTKEQLENLNGFFRQTIEHESNQNSDTNRIEASVEKLVQRLVSGVGNLDRRFSTMFVVSLNERRRVKQLKFEYLLRIDALSTPGIYSECESAANVEEDSSLPGFARLRIRSSEAETWAEFLGPGGKLRRDLVRAKLVNLLAAVTKQELSKEAEEGFCQAPGQIVDAEVLDKILKQPDHCRIFFGSDTTEEKMEGKDHRVALVEDASGILLRIGMDDVSSSTSHDVEVRLLIGAGVASWSTLADYPRRVPLHHCDALIHYTAAQSGMYAVTVGPHPGARCDDRATLWRLRVPAAETIMTRHYSEESVPALSRSVLMEIIEQLRGRRTLNVPMKQKDCLRVVSRHIVETIHWWSLERAGPDPLRSWSPDTLSRHVLLALDELVTALKCQNLRCYFYPRCNVMLQCARGGFLHHEDSYVSDARLLESYLTALHRFSTTLIPVGLRPSDVLENELITRWRRVMTSLPRGTMSGHYGYSTRQLDYISIIVKEVLRLKDNTLQARFDECSFLSFPTSSQTSEPAENLLYLLTLVLKQARDQIYAMTDRRKRKRQRLASLKDRGKSRYHEGSAYFERSVDVLLDVVRHDRETAYLDLESDLIMTKTLLRWLYFAMENDLKILGPILRPYLGNLFNASHENAWHVESCRKRREIYNSEMRSLALFCKLVTAQETSPADGIVESLSKGWNWAEHVTRMIERSNDGLRLVFLTPHKILKYNLTFANNKGLSAFSTWSKARNIGNATRRAIIARTNIITATDRLPNWNEGTASAEKLNKGIASHVELRDASPLTYVVSMSRRRGRQRGPGGLIPALVALNKFRILQEAAAVLPQDERVAMLDIVQRVSREASRRLRRTSCPDLTASGSPRQTYTPRSENQILDPTPERLSPSSRQRRIIAERQELLHREMLEINDTLTRGLRSRARLPTWDSSSVASWTSSIGSTGRSRFRKSRTPIWETMRGTSPMWDRVSIDENLAKSCSEEMMSREESPKWNLENCRRRNALDPIDDERLPSWDFLETALNRKLARFENQHEHRQSRASPSFTTKNSSVDYPSMANASKEFPRENLQQQKSRRISSSKTTNE